MALSGGNAIRGEGLAGAISRARKKKYPKYDPAKDKGLDEESRAIVEYLINNIEVYVDPDTGQGVIR